MRNNITINETLISYRTAGAGTRPIIFLHGWRSEAAVWQPIFDQLHNAPYALYALDLPGFGASETPKKPMTLEDYANIVVGFAKALNIPTGNITLVGHSFGARIAVKIATTQTDFAKKIMLVGSGGNRPSKLMRLIKTILAKSMKPFFAPGFMRPLREKIYRAMGTEDYIETPELRGTFVAIVSEDIVPLLPRVTAQTLVVWGENDTTAPVAYGRRMTRAIPDARFELIKNAGHYCFMDQPKQFTQLFLDFIQ